MRTRSIGGVEVSAIGLGAMPLSVTPQRPAKPDAVRVVHAALDAGPQPDGPECGGRGRRRVTA